MAKRAQQARAVESQRLHFPALDELTRNSDASARLIARLRALNPDRSLDWCEEKAIYDIKRVFVWLDKWESAKTSRH